jgi:hypothetical protein
MPKDEGKTGTIRHVTGRIIRISWESRLVFAVGSELVGGRGDGRLAVGWV